MSETVEHYIERLLGYVEGKQPLDVLASTAGKLERLIAGVSPAELRKRPAPTNGRRARSSPTSTTRKSSAGSACD